MRFEVVVYVGVILWIASLIDGSDLCGCDASERPRAFIREYADRYTPPAARRPIVNPAPIVIEEPPPPPRMSKFAVQPLATFPWWFPRGVKNNPRIAPLWWFRIGDDGVAAVIIDIGRSTHEVRFYREQKAHRTRELRKLQPAIEWADAERAGLSSPPAASTLVGPRKWGSRRAGSPGH